jgi:hypothetical protein
MKKVVDNDEQVNDEATKNIKEKRIGTKEIMKEKAFGEQ